MTHPHPRPVLHVERIGRVYGGVQALRDVTLDVAVGARHALIGANGAGKSTLLNLIAGTSRPTGGRIVFDGRDITPLRPAGRARLGIGRTWQHPALFAHLPVAAHMLIALTGTAGSDHGHGRRRREVDARARVLLEQAGLGAYADSVAGTLPYGLRRRVELAVALAARPRLLLLDEPSAGLAPEEITALADTLRALPPDVTVLLADHHLTLVFDLATTITVLHHGAHLTTGTSDAVRADPAVQNAYPTATRARASATRPQPADRDGVPLVQVRDLSAGYGGAPVLHHISLDVDHGDVVAVLGRNGAGKTTLLNALAGVLPTTPAGTVHLAGRRLPTHPHLIARAGVAIAPQGRGLWQLTVAEHLTLAAATAKRRTNLGHPWTREDILAVLPRLRDRLHHPATRLSGGEQQMLALARALLARPRLLLLDEPSEGLAPTVIADLTRVLQLVAAHDVTVVLAEHNLTLALDVASRVLVLADGRIALDLPAADVPAAQLDDLLGVALTGTRI